MKSINWLLLLLLVPGIGWSDDHDDGVLITPSNDPYTVLFTSAVTYGSELGTMTIPSSYKIVLSSNPRQVIEYCFTEDSCKDMAEALNEAHERRTNPCPAGTHSFVDNMPMELVPLPPCKLSELGLGCVATK